MKLKTRNMTQEPVQPRDLWALLVLFAVVGAYLGTWIFLLIFKAT